MTMPAKASHAAGRCFDVFCIEDHPRAGEVFADLLASEARGETMDLDVDTDFELRLCARLDGLAPVKRYRANRAKSDSILAEIRQTVLAAGSPGSAVSDMLLALSSRRRVAELDRLTLLVRALSDGDVFDRITPGRPEESGATLPASRKASKAQKASASRKATRTAKARPAASTTPAGPSTVVTPDAAGFGTTGDSDSRRSINFRISPLSSGRRPDGTKTTPPDPEMSNRNALYADANRAIERDGGCKLKKHAMAALKALHEGHSLYHDHDAGVLHVQVLSATVLNGRVTEICMDGGSQRYDKPCSEDHWEDVDMDWIADDYRDAFLTPFGLRKTIEIFGPIYTPVIVHDPEIDDTDGDDGVNPQARVVYPTGWTGPRLPLPSMLISELPAAAMPLFDDA